MFAPNQLNSTPSSTSLAPLGTIWKTTSRITGTSSAGAVEGGLCGSGAARAGARRLASSLALGATARTFGDGMKASMGVGGVGGGSTAASASPSTGGSRSARAIVNAARPSATDPSATSSARSASFFRLRLAFSFASRLRMVRSFGARASARL